jgi:hypothetical protein
MKKAWPATSSVPPITTLRQRRERVRFKMAAVGNTWRTRASQRRHVGIPTAAPTDQQATRRIQQYYKLAILEVLSKKMFFYKTLNVAQLLSCLIVNTNFATVLGFQSQRPHIGADEAVLIKLTAGHDTGLKKNGSVVKE